MTFAKCLRSSLTLALCLGSTLLQAQTPDEVRARCRMENRPCVGLVLSGGGARGFAHVGVIKVLEELGIRIDVIAGTSMGAMVGGAYAAGFSYEQLLSTVLGVDWDQMIAPRADRSILPFRRKLDDYKSLPVSGIEIGSDGMPQLPESFVPSEELQLFLNDKTGSVAMIEDLSRLSIPFASTATDLVTGERVVMQKGCNLGEAMRASMSLPGVFAPVPFHKHLLVDGGLIDNLPVELARSMGADVLIVVNVGTPLSKRSELTSVVGVMAQMVNLLTEQNVRKSLESLGPSDVLITPDLEGFTSADLKRSAEIIERGEAAARRAQSRLLAFARPIEEFNSWNIARMAPFREEAQRKVHQLSDVRVAARRRAAVAPERVLSVADVPVDKAVTNKELDDAARRVWAEGNFETVTYRFDPGPNGTEVLVFEPREKRAGYSSVRLGGSVQTNFDSDSSFNLLFAHTWHLLNDWGGEWRNEIQIGQDRKFSSEFFQPLGAGSPWFIQPSVDYSRVPFDVYADDRPVARRRNETLQLDLMFGRELDRVGYAGVSAGWTRSKSTQEIGPMLLGMLAVKFFSIRSTTSIFQRAALDLLQPAACRTIRPGIRAANTITRLMHWFLIPSTVGRLRSVRRWGAQPCQALFRLAVPAGLQDRRMGAGRGLACNMDGCRLRAIFPEHSMRSSSPFGLVLPPKRDALGIRKRGPQTKVPKRSGTMLARFMWVSTVSLARSF